MPKHRSALKPAQPDSICEAVYRLHKDIDTAINMQMLIPHVGHLVAYETFEGTKPEDTCRRTYRVALVTVHKTTRKYVAKEMASGRDPFTWPYKGV